MPYDEHIADRIREELADVPFTEQRMFGGLAFLVGGHMAVCAARAGDVLARVPADEYEAARAEPGVHDFVMRGKPMRGWLVVTPADDEIGRWVRRGVAVAQALPPK